MLEFIEYITTVFALVLVVEGLVYALFPDAVRRMMAMALTLPPGRLRQFGFIVAASGLFMVWLMGALTGAL